MATTLTDIKRAIASYFEISPGDMVVNGQDLALLALNQVRRQAELTHDFEFQRKLVTLTVNGVTGGSLEDVVLYSDGVTPVDVKTVVDIGLFDTGGNLRPVEWTLVSESIERQRAEERFSQTGLDLRDSLSYLATGVNRFTLSGTDIFRFPKDASNNYPIGLEVYGFTPDWEADTVTLSGVDDYPDGVYFETNLFGQQAFVRYHVGTNMWVIWSNGTSWYVTQAADFNNTSASTKGYLATPTNVSSPAGTYVTSGSFGTGPITVTAPSSIATSPWLSYGAQFLQWGAIVQLNHLYKRYVFRQEGNLPPPEKLRDEGLQSFIAWDANRYDLNRRHNR